MTAPLRLADLTWPEVEEIAPRSALAVPLGATEQHGPHLPFTVDTDIATALAERLTRARPHAILAPAISYGSSGEHAAFPGTLSIGQDATEFLLTELVRSADSFAGVILVNGHGGNRFPLHRALARLHHEGRRVHAWQPSGPPGDTHAGRIETSIMLALRTEAVQTGRMAPGTAEPLSKLMDVLRERGVRAISKSGVLGDPRGASPDDGQRLLTEWSQALITDFDQWWQQR